MSDEYWYEPEFRDERHYGERFGPVYEPPKRVATLIIGTARCAGRNRVHVVETALYDNGCISILGEPTERCGSNDWPKNCGEGRRRIDPAEAERIMDALRRDIDGFREKIPKP